MYHVLLSSLIAVSCNALDYITLLMLDEIKRLPKARKVKPTYKSPNQSGSKRCTYYIFAGRNTQQIHTSLTAKSFF